MAATYCNVKKREKLKIIRTKRTKKLRSEVPKALLQLIETATNNKERPGKGGGVGEGRRETKDKE